MTPEILAPGVVPLDGFIEMGCAWSPDVKEFYFVRSETSALSPNPSALCVQREEGGMDRATGWGMDLI